MAQVHPQWWAQLPTTYEPDRVMITAALSRRLHLTEIAIPDRIYLVGALSDPPHALSAASVADMLHCHLRTVRKYRALWALSGMAQAHRGAGASSDEILIALHLPTLGTARTRIGSRSPRYRGRHDR